ncbi:A-agglutinin anchorage subunit-like [Anneissia japonica]|uniref:A-agglutinin anchorage subunit-like n=1 Tax=Anneissia japonica TaxID=1529436 RepID=UPI0014256CC8|nr:A-agglutinin anchorage subunit-like [Anneissia japonica]
MSSRRGLGVFILTVCFSFISVCNGTSTATVQTTDPTNFNMGSTQEMSTNDSPTTKPTTAIITTTGGVVSTKGLTQDTSTNNFPTTKPTTETTAILIATTGGVVSTKRSTQDTSTNDSPTTKPTTETTTTIGLITTTGGVVSTKGSTQKKSTNDSPTTTTTLIHSTSYDTTTQDNKGPSPITNIDTTVAKITSTLYSTTGPMKEATTSSSTTTKPPKYYLISIENSGVNVKLNIPSDEFDENKFKSSIAENTIMYCTAENSKCEDNYKYISSSDVIIYHQGSKPYFEVNTEYDILADDELHVSFYVKDPYTDTLTVMNTEQATSMLNEQKGNIEEELNYEFEIETPYTKPDGFPGWAISLIVFCVICIFVAIYVFWRAKKLE